MNTMKMPGFTADASIYKTSGHYQSDRQQLINLSMEMRGAIYPARDEVIVLHSCPPGFTDLGGTCWPDPLTEPSGGGSSGEFPATPGVPFDNGGGGPAPPPTPTRPPRPPRRPPNYNPTPLGRCNVPGNIDRGYYLNDPDKGRWECCREAGGGPGLTCIVCEQNDLPELTNFCRDGHV